MSKIPAAWKKLKHKRMLITGDRDWVNPVPIRQAIEYLKPNIVIEGEAPGADRLSYKVAKEMEIQTAPYPALWRTASGYNKAAGVQRNSQMLYDGKPHFGLAFHSDLRHSRGTRDMVRKLLKANVPTWLFDGNKWMKVKRLKD